MDGRKKKSQATGKNQTLDRSITRRALYRCAETAAIIFLESTEMSDSSSSRFGSHGANNCHILVHNYKHEKYSERITEISVSQNFDQ